MDSLLRRLFTYHLPRALFLCGLALALGLGHPFHRVLGVAPAAAQDRRPVQLVQDGVNAYSDGDYATAIAAWSQALTAYPATAFAERAIINENLARAHQQIGETKAAIESWEAAATAYQQTDNPTQLGRILTEQAQVHISLGQHQRATALLCGGEATLTTAAQAGESSQATVDCARGAYAIATAMGDGVGQAAALGSLAETYRLRGEYETAQALLNAGLKLVRTQTLTEYEAPLLNSLGNTYARQFRMAARRLESALLLNVNEDVVNRLQAELSEDKTQALNSFTEAIRVATAQQDWRAELRSRLGLLSMAKELDAVDEVEASLQRLGDLIQQLPASRETAYAAITLAQAYQTTSQDYSCRGYPENPQLQQWLETGRRIAEGIGDARAESFALGALGHQEECRGHLAEAAQLTNQAQLAANDALESADSLYLWQWQIGRIHLRRHERDTALTAYQQAIATLESIRTDLLTTNRELQFDFRDTVEPVYRQYIELQLEATPAITATKQTGLVDNASLGETLKTIDALRLAELQNFFGDDCVLVSSSDARENLLAGVSKTTVISSIVLSDRTALIANFPNGKSKVVWINDTEALKQTADQYRSGLKRYVVRTYNQAPAQQLYQQLIGPLEPELMASGSDTLVFIHDGFLRNIPMAALYDGNHYLIQRYAIATTPSLGLTAPQATGRRELRALAVGLSQSAVTESGQAFPSLRSIPAELAVVSQQLPGSTTLLNEEFTVEQFEAALLAGAYPILHLATHGQFSTIPEETFVVTGPGEPNTAGELTFGQLETLILEASPNAEPIDLITLTACETATGDDRATLGLAGVAIRAGARSAIASLWKIDDATAAQLINEFYGNLKKPGVSKAQAMQAAQIKAIDAAGSGANPGSWAPLILVGNWQ